MKSYLYHSPVEPRTLYSKDAPVDGVVDLTDKEGNLEIGKCTIGTEVGQCSPTDAPKAEK